jgi:hypothetical protein
MVMMILLKYAVAFAFQYFKAQSAEALTAKSPFLRNALFSEKASGLVATVCPASA